MSSTPPPTTGLALQCIQWAKFRFIKSNVSAKSLPFSLKRKYCRSDSYKYLQSAKSTKSNDCDENVSEKALSAFRRNHDSTDIDKQFGDGNEPKSHSIDSDSKCYIKINYEDLNGSTDYDESSESEFDDDTIFDQGDNLKNENKVSNDKKKVMVPKQGRKYGGFAGKTTNDLILRAKALSFVPRNRGVKQYVVMDPSNDRKEQIGFECCRELDYDELNNQSTYYEESSDDSEYDGDIEPSSYNNMSFINDNNKELPALSTTLSLKISNLDEDLDEDFNSAHCI